MKPRKPTPAQLAALARVRDERIAKVTRRWYRERATYTEAGFVNTYAPLDAEDKVCGKEIAFRVMLRLFSRGWVDFDGIIARLTDAGRALLVTP